MELQRQEMLRVFVLWIHSRWVRHAASYVTRFSRLSAFDEVPGSFGAKSSVIHLTVYWRDCAFCPGQNMFSASRSSVTVNWHHFNASDAKHKILSLTGFEPVSVGSCRTWSVRT